MHPQEIKRWLARVGGRANQRLGQHFLIDRAVLNDIVDAAHIQPGDQVIEIGPGLGVLTAALLARGARVFVIERDRRFAQVLQERFAPEIKAEKLNIKIGDATASPLRAPRTSPGSGEDDQILPLDKATVGSYDPGESEGVDVAWKFVSNLPYQITSFALRQAVWCEHPPVELVVLIQREVAERAIAKNGKQSLLSLMIGLASVQAHIVRRVPRGAFYPAPKVESAILRVVPLTSVERASRWGIDPERIMALAKQGFAHPRKRLASNIQLDVTRIGLPADIRAEDVTLDKWAALARLREPKP